ncbi:DUF6660 family protein [Christiangramia salexigens]|uniref:DUF6660 family protein n=1 Tax=Christiangramia salexigens TaxID=1913577 RepID=UPI0012EB6504|nr:DUF6660 family protein [Christiangramia salexigens]
MKLLSIILSFYLVGLTFMPCEDEVVQENESRDQLAEHSTDNGLTDTCTPFCQCHCCHAHVLTFTSPALDFSTKGISTLIADLKQHSGMEIPKSHFQPPRI